MILCSPYISSRQQLSRLSRPFFLFMSLLWYCFLYFVNKSYITCHAILHIQPQVTQARNMSIGENRDCCLTFEIPYKDLYGEKTHRFCIKPKKMKGFQ